MSELNTIDGLLEAMDHAIAQYEETEAQIEQQFGAAQREDPVIYSNYKAQKANNDAVYDRRMQDLRGRARRLCDQIRDSQPVLMDLDQKHINMKSGFPRRLVFGKYRVTYNHPTKGLDFHMPRMLPFPLQKPVCINKNSELPFIHQLLLRLLFTLPVDKQEYYFFDPRGLGRSVRDFNRLFTSEKLVPQQKIMMSTQELKDALRHVELYIRDLYTHTFNRGVGENWEEYSRYWFERNERRKMLPYRVFVFMDVPLGMDQDCFRMFCNLLEHNGTCGILVLFSCDEVVWTESKERIRSNMEQELLQLVRSKCVHPEDCFSELSNQRLKLSSSEEKMPPPAQIHSMMDLLCQAAETDLGSMFSFAEMLSEESLFSRRSNKGLELPVGYDMGEA